jgi:hypothetical protein
MEGIGSFSGGNPRDTVINRGKMLGNDTKSSCPDLFGWIDQILR